MLTSLLPLTGADAQVLGGTPPTTPLVCVAGGVGRQVFVSGKLREALGRLLAGSELFRARYSQVVRAGVVVGITYHGLFHLGEARAATRIHRVDGRVQLALVRVKPGHDPVELIAHEFEHIVEQLEGVDYHDHLASRRGNTRVNSGQAFETDRAAAAGRSAARQVRDAERAQKKPGPQPTACSTLARGAFTQIALPPRAGSPDLHGGQLCCEP
ncbi:MAG: hypothetical protein GEU99_16520 [Luteitalea sp.]|nr:hypothetical protein [Luteitalea sp.]